MASPARIPLGAPGLYLYPDVPQRALTRVRMDVCGFAGVAPRGPARVRADGSPDVPARRTVVTAVESFDEYRQIYGGFEGPGLLPYAVASFFEQGGLRAYIARIVHDYLSDPAPDPAASSQGVATANIPGLTSASGPLVLRSRNEGSWGSGLSAGVDFTASPLIFDVTRASQMKIELPAGVTLSPGTLLHLNPGGGLHEFRFVALTIETRLPNKPGSIQTVTFDTAASAVPQSADVIEASLGVDDGAGRSENFAGLGLSPAHPRWIGQVLTGESALVYPDSSAIGSPFKPVDPDLAAPPARVRFSPVEDRYRDITPDDFFDSDWTPGDEEPGDGLHAFAQLSDLSLLVAPDVYSPFALTDPAKLEAPVSLAGAEFARCADPVVTASEPEPPPQDVVKLRRDPADPQDLEDITLLQLRMVEFAEQIRSFVVLIDVPPGLTKRRILTWRSRFDSSWVAAYHPWLTVVRRDDDRNTPIPLPPSAAAAGIAAQVEKAFGVPQGPANVVAAQVLDVRETVSGPLHDELHPLGINVFLREPAGVRLTAARTLSSDPDFRQLSVRRLLVLIRRTLEQQMQWAVFEPNNAALRAELRQLLRVWLRQLFRSGAFRGATEEESFFVRCDDTNNPARIGNLGQLLVEVGVAPAEPLEFIVLRLSRDADGSLTSLEARG